MSGLRRNRSFWMLTASQFLGAFNDNAYRMFILLLARSELTGDAQSLAMALFALPFVIFALLGGAIADRYSKRRVIVIMNAIEIAVMVVGVLVFAFQRPDIAIFLSMGVLALMGAQSAFFGPAKYGSIPELVAGSELSRANGIISMTTWVAIILGTLLAGGLNNLRNDYDLEVYWAGFVFIAIAALGFLFSLGIRKLPVADPRRVLPLNILLVFSHAVREVRYLARDRDLLLAVLGLAWFSLIGAVTLQALNKYGADALGREDTMGTALMWAVAVGIGLGSLLAARLSGDRVELGIVPLGAVGLSAGLASLYWIPTEYWIVCVALILTGIFGGLYVVPLNTFVQQRPNNREKGRIMGANELINFIFICAAAGVYFLLANVLFPATETDAAPERLLAAQKTMLLLGVLTLTGAGLICSLTPQYLMRSILWALTHTIYRIRVRHPERLPLHGGALLVSNHVSYADPFLVGSSTSRLVRFVMHRGFLQVPVVGGFGRLMGAVFVADTDSPRELVTSLGEVSDHIASGNLACIFAEGGITRTGNLRPFSKGLERIARKARVPIVPVYIDRMWGSIFSFRGGRFFFKRPTRFPYPVTVAVGEPLPPDTPTHRVREAVEELSVEAFEARKRDGETLATRFLKVARRHPRRPAAYDHTRQQLNYRKLLTGALLLRRRIRPRLATDANHVGVLLPPSNGGAVANLALTLLNKVTVNLNYTVSAEAYESAITQCKIGTIITSRAFTQKLKIAEDSRAIDIADLFVGASRGDKIVALCQALLPVWILKRALHLERNPDADATVIFSSGSTGTPKGVCLTHHNILSNVRSLTQVFDVSREDRLVGVLPFFHSFGYMVAVWFPFLNGIMALYHTSPLDTRELASLIREKKGTIFFSTPTFYQSYLRRFEKKDFQSVRLAVSGAEKLKESLAHEWYEKFGSGIYEGYGCTELSPVVSLNLPGVQLEHVQQVGSKPGTAGHPLPGVAARIVDPDTLERLGPGQEGLLLVKGPNVMRGYFNRPDLTEEVIRDGWYYTGDVARIDFDGFITITDRLSRFSKIGGEMVPHVRVEEVLQGIIAGLSKCEDGAQQPDCPEVAVTSVPDAKKGERLVVLHSALGYPISMVVERLRDSALPNLWLPREDSFYEVPEIPKLGSGKFDLRSLKTLAQDKQRIGTRGPGPPADS